MTDKEKEGLQSAPDDEQDVSKDLVRSAAVIDHAIAFLEKENNTSIAIASACLGGALTLLARDMDKEPILRILETAAQNVRSGEVHASIAEKK